MVEKTEKREGRAWILTIVLGVFIVLQLYLLRELLAAEILFGVLFVVLLLAGLSAYVVGSLAERGIEVFAANTYLLVHLSHRFKEFMHRSHAFSGHS